MIANLQLLSVQSCLKINLSRKEMDGCFLAAGMPVFGAIVVILAILYPDPTSKPGLLIMSGAVLLLTGGLTGMRIAKKKSAAALKLYGQENEPGTWAMAPAGR